MKKRIVYTRFDGGVSIYCPADECVRWMGCGGFWDEHPPGFMLTQIDRQIARGIAPDVARCYARAVQFGGCTTAEALEILRDRDCAPRGTAIELWDAADVPSDRWFRNAWRRSANGGPIRVDLALARPIQFQRARAAVHSFNMECQRDMDRIDEAVEMDWKAFRERIRSARDTEELRRIFPPGVVKRSHMPD